MSNKAKTLPLISVALLGLCLFILLVSVVTEVDTTFYQEQKVAINGKLDLKTLDITNSQPIPLSGEWEFYWQQFVLSDNFATDIDAPHTLLKTPSSW
jgi:hypothetical protein